MPAKVQGSEQRFAVEKAEPFAAKAPSKENEKQHVKPQAPVAFSLGLLKAMTEG